MEFCLTAKQGGGEGEELGGRGANEVEEWEGRREEKEKMDPLVKPEDDGNFWGWMTGAFWGRMTTPNLRHSGRRSGIHLAMDGSLVYGATGG